MCIRDSSYAALRCRPLWFGQLSVDVLNPEDRVVGHAEQRAEVSEGKGYWHEEIKLLKPMSMDALVWHRVRYRFEYKDEQIAKIEGLASISQILRTPVIHILGQQSYLTGSLAAVRVIVTDSNNEVIAGRGSVQIELLSSGEKSRILFTCLLYTSRCV